MSFIVFTIFLIMYYAVHSLLAANFVKIWFYENAVSEKYYRLFFNLVAVVGLLVLTYYYFLLDKQLLIQNAWVGWSGGLLAFTGLVWTIKAMRGYDVGEFLGTYQLKNSTRPKSTELVVNGLNAQVRHPLYFGTLLILWGAFFVLPTDAVLTIASISTLYLIIGAKLEERKLEQQFGQAYRLYMQHVPMLLPFSWRSSWK